MGKSQKSCKFVGKTYIIFIKLLRTYDCISFCYPNSIAHCTHDGL